MTAVSVLNNKAAQLIASGKLVNAELELDRAQAILDQRSPAIPNAKDFNPALDEYFYRSHRLNIGWLRERWDEALPHAERAWALETGMAAAARAAKVGDLASVGFNMGAWGLISILTRLRRFEDAEKIFEAVVADDSFFWARMRRERAAAEKILIAGLCIYFERKDATWMAHGRALIERAQRLVSPDDPELVFGYACYWARIGQAKQACEALESALSRGVTPERMFADEDLRSLHSNDRFQSLVMDRVFTCKVSSEPKGARLFIDGTDTGLCTPARMHPLSPGRHHIRLSLEGFDDAECWHVQERDAGLSLGLVLESKQDVAARQRMAEDSTRAPDSASRAKTRAFLGDEAQLEKARIVVVRQTTYGLGELAITVHGDGRAEVRHLEFATPRKVHEASLRLNPQEAHRIFDAFVDEAFTEMLIAPHSGVPDELYFTVELTNARARTCQLGKFVQTEHRRFERLVKLVHESVAAQLDAKTRKRLTL